MVYETKNTLIKSALLESFGTLAIEKGLEYCEISQWLSLAIEFQNLWEENGLDGITHILINLDSVLQSRSYLAKNDFTVADAVLLEALIPTIKHIESYLNISRWFNHIQVKLKLSPSYPLALHNSPLLVPVSLFASIEMDKANKDGVSLAVAETIRATNPIDASEVSKELKESAGGEEAKKTESSSKKEKKSKSAAAIPSPAPAPATESTVAASTSSGDVSVEFSPSLLDIRVGLVVKCWNHPDSEKLLCEEVDLGESSGPRQIASGIRAHYAANEVEGRKVLVLSNLKERSVAGFKSQVNRMSVK